MNARIDGLTSEPFFLKIGQVTSPTAEALSHKGPNLGCLAAVCSRSQFSMSDKMISQDLTSKFKAPPPVPSVPRTSSGRC